MNTRRRQRDTVLLTLGRLPVALDLARSFHRAGWRVVVAEPFGMHLCRMSRAVDRSLRLPAPRNGPRRYLEALRRAAMAEGASLVVPVSEESLHVAALRDDLPPGIAVYGAPRDRLFELHDKLTFHRLARRHGLDVPATAAADAPERETLCAEQDYVLKPRHSCSGRGVSYHRRGERLPPAPGMVVQERLDGEPLSTFAVARDGVVIGGVAYRPAIESGSVAVCFERVDDVPAVTAWVERFVAATVHDGFIAFDFIVDADGRPRAIECNPRATSGIHFLATDDLAPAMLGRVGQIARREDALLAESWSAFTATLGALLGPGDFAGARRRLSAARDISWSRHDPWPFLLMMVNTWRLIGLAAMKRRTFAEVAALDIEWRDEARDGAGTR